MKSKRAASKSYFPTKPHEFLRENLPAYGILTNEDPYAENQSLTNDEVLKQHEITMNDSDLYDPRYKKLIELRTKLLKEKKRSETFKGDLRTQPEYIAGPHYNYMTDEVKGIYNVKEIQDGQKPIINDRKMSGILAHELGHRENFVKATLKALKNDRQLRDLYAELKAGSPDTDRKDLNAQIKLRVDQVKEEVMRYRGGLYAGGGVANLLTSYFSAKASVRDPSIAPAVIALNALTPFINPQMHEEVAASINGGKILYRDSRKKGRNKFRSALAAARAGIGLPSYLLPNIAAGGIAALSAMKK